MIYLDLFLGFLKVGCFAFGGAYGAIPLIRDVVLSYGWLSDDTLTYMIAVSESTPGLDRRPPPRWMGGQGGQSLKVLVRALSDFEVFSFSKLNNQNKFFRLKKFYLLSSSMPYFFFCRIT